MCNFLSWVLTENEIYTVGNSSHHTAIIEEHKLRDDPNHILKVEIVPPAGNLAAPASKWSYRVDQDIMPRWFDAASARKRVLRATNSWMRLRPWWKHMAAIIEEHKAIQWLKPDGNPDPTWKLFAAPTWDAARDAAWDAGIHGVCGDLPLDQKHRDHVGARMNAWRKGYAVLCDVGGVLYVYAAGG